MSDTLQGKITISKRLRRHAVWDQEPACYGKAWVDLLLLANDAPRAVTIHGEMIQLQRGQLAWSQRRLEMEWKRSDFWVKRFLKYCQDETMILLDVTRRRTIITILNYEAYNPLISRTDLDTDLDSEHRTDLDTDLEQKGETGRGIGKGEAKPPQNQDFAELPPEAEVLSFAAGYPGDLARGIPAVIPATWASDWFRYKAGSGQWPKKWREKMAADFMRDWVAGHPKARSLRTTTIQAPGRSPAQARFELSRELEEIQARLDACHENGVEPEARDSKREKELKKLLREMPK